MPKIPHIFGYQNGYTLEKYLFFYLKTGGGHLAPAKAVKEYIYTHNLSGIEIILADGLDGTGFLPRKIIQDGYKTAVCNAVWVFEFLYALNKIPLIAKITSSLVTMLIRRGVERQILQNFPDKIILFHFFLIKPVYEILGKYRMSIPVLTVVTDPFSAHPLWFLEKGQNYVVFSEALREKCLKSGIDDGKLKVFPFVLQKNFIAKPGRPALRNIRNELGYRPDSRIILILGGGEGMPRGLRLSKVVIQRTAGAEIAIVCGNDKRMYRKLDRLRIKHRLENVKIYGYIDYVHSLIRISDVIITKCGASTIMEILVSGKVPLINNYIWEQEKGNMEFVCNAEMGILEKRVRCIPEVVNRLFTDPCLFDTLRVNIKKASVRNGLVPVSEYIMKYNL